MIKNNEKQKGQALLLVIVAMTVALALGVNISTRTLSTVSRTTRTDTSERVRSAAEGGAERVLNQPVTILSQLASTDPATVAAACSGAALAGTPNGTECVFDFNPVSGDNITGRARVKVSDNVITSEYKFKLERDSVTEVFLNNTVSSVNVCWTFVDNSNPVDIYYILYSVAADSSTASLISKGYGETGAITTSGYNPHNSLSPSGAYCLNGINSTGAQGLRLRAIGGDAKVTVTNSSGGGLPSQGFKIDSVGELEEDGVVKSIKEVLVYKSYPYLPGIFDFGVMSGSGAFDYY